MSNKKLDDLLAFLVKEAGPIKAQQDATKKPDETPHQFTLYVSGSRNDDMRRITGYCIAGQRRVMLEPTQVIRFKLGEMRNYMLEYGFDFTMLPVAQGPTLFNWLMTLSQAPSKFMYMRSNSDRADEKKAQNDRFDQMRKFEAYRKEILLNI